jgi:hypothetical protein
VKPLSTVSKAVRDKRIKIRQVMRLMDCASMACTSKYFILQSGWWCQDGRYMRRCRRTRRGRLLFVSGGGFGFGEAGSQVLQGCLLLRLRDDSADETQDKNPDTGKKLAKIHVEGLRTESWERV